MKKRLSAALLLLLLFLWACGKKGEILPPLARIPESPAVLSLAQRGTNIILEWVNPSTYADGRLLPGLSRVEIWRADAGAEGGAFESRAVLQAVVLSADFPRYRAAEDRSADVLAFALALEAGLLDGRPLFFGIRALDTGQRKSPFSAWRAIRARRPPRPPEGLKAEVRQDAVALRWEPSSENVDGSAAAPPAGYRILRAEGDGPLVLLTDVPVPEPFFEDKDFEFGRVYRYAVRTSVTAEGPIAESEDSSALEVAPRDNFPPSPPAGLATIPGGDFISLIWDPNGETDLAGYRVWRREEGSADFAPLGDELVSGTTFIDRAVEKGKSYEYAVSAEDRAGNRSRLSDGVVDSPRTARS
ncbi:MAG: fibronectin type III domain-containing protein [Candidatus Aminicenantes bacterium]|nr:fibronectin type III domain-containing protein [Candidatus Aminicenantes bacterium]